MILNIEAVLAAMPVELRALAKEQLYTMYMPAKKISSERQPAFWALPKNNMNVYTKSRACPKIDKRKYCGLDV